MPPAWQRVFLTVGMAVAVLGMRLVSPLLLVSATAHLTLSAVVRLALARGNPGTPGTYCFLLRAAHPAIAGFGAAFLAMLFLDFILTPRDVTWLTWVERPLQRIGRLERLPIVVVGCGIEASSFLVDSPRQSTVLIAGCLGLVAYLVVNGLSELFSDPNDVAPAIGKAGLALFLYLEALDASFSFDGVVGAFAITADPVLITIGLGMGAWFTRSLTVTLVRSGTLATLVYLEHGAMWAVGALSGLLVLSLHDNVPDIVIGLIGAGFIASAAVTSWCADRYERC